MADTRRCIGSTRFGIEAHEASVKDFPKQPSQKDGLGRMCKTHWNQYTAALARDAMARKVGIAPPTEVAADVPVSVDVTLEPMKPRRKAAKSEKTQPEGDAA